MKSGFNLLMVCCAIRAAIGTCLIGVFLIGTVIDVSAANISIQYDSEKLTADVSNGTLHKVLDELSKKTGITILLDTSLKSKKISAKFERISLDQGIKKLIAPYSSAIVYEKKIDAAGKNVFFVSELKVFEESKAGAVFMLVGDKGGLPVDQDGNSKKATNAKITDKSVASAPIPERVKDPARAAEYHKKVGVSVARARINRARAKIRHLKNKMRYEEAQKRHEIQEYEIELQEAPEDEARIVQSKLNLCTTELRKIKNRNSEELRRLQRELSQLKRSQVMAGSASGATNE